MDARECIVPDCFRCDRIDHMLWGATGSFVKVCSTYYSPRAVWRRGCPFRTEMKDNLIIGKVRVGQQKQKQKGV